MININQFISQYVTERPYSMFIPDIKKNEETLTKEIEGKKVCVIGDAGTKLRNVSCWMTTVAMFNCLFVLTSRAVYDNV